MRPIDLPRAGTVPIRGVPGKPATQRVALRDDVDPARGDVDRRFTLMGFFLPLDGYGYGTIQIGKALNGRARLLDMQDADGGFGTAADHWMVSGPAVACCVPDFLPRITADRLIAHTMFEATRLPAGWVQKLNCCARAVAVPCEWNREVFVECGVRVPVHVTRWGVDSSDYWPLERQTDRPFTFLWSGTPDKRKGWDLAYRCFLKAFGKRDDVRLVLHFRHLPRGLASIGDPNVEIVTGLRDRPALREMLQGADCFVFPSRGEGWGLPPREAAATGLPVIATDWGGLHEEIERWAYPLRVAGMSPARYGFAQWGDIGEWAEPDPEHLIELYRRVESNREAAAAFGARASAWLARETPWTRTAEALGAVVEEVRMEKHEGMLRIRWTGPRVVRRIAGEYEWSARAGWEQDVPEALALELLTAPGERFELVDEVGVDVVDDVDGHGQTGTNTDG